MNPLTNVRNITKLNERELALGVEGKNSWHNMYRDSAWVFIGGLNYDMSEGDVITVFSQYGEVVNINLIRDQKTGKSKGYGFLCYEDQRSTILAVDNLNGIKLLNRTIRVDHVSNYRMPKEHDDTDAITKKLYADGCAPQVITFPINTKQEDSKQILEININIKNEKKRKRKRKRKRDSSESSDSTTSSSSSDSRSKKSKNKSKRIESNKYDKKEKYSSDKSGKRDYDRSRYDREKSQYKYKSDKQRKTNDSKSKHY